MSIVTNGGVVHLPFGERPAYGTPYPEGIAVAHVDVTGDATSGSITVTMLADGKFLYRLEALNMTRNDTIGGSQTIITSHRMLSDRSGLGVSAFDLNWQLEQQQQAASGFSVALPAISVLAAIRRLPIGRTDDVALQSIVSFIDETNTDTIVYDFDALFSYWPTTALAVPGFLSSFWESPVVPSTVPLG